DGDGLCDPIDPCPRVPRGSAFGDRCSCREGKPGRCVPAIGAASRRCAVEWLPMAAPPTSLGLPASVIRCKDGNPTCDVDRERGQCTFEVLVCIDNSDPRFPSCGPRVTNAVEVVSADVRRAADRATTANTAALADALDALTGTPDECTAPIPLVVPMRGKRSGGRVFALRAHTSGGMVQSTLRLAVVALLAGSGVGAWAIVTEVSLVEKLHGGELEHTDETALRGMRNRDAYLDAFTHGDAIFSDLFNAVDGAGANIGNGARFSRFPRADLVGNDAEGRAM